MLDESICHLICTCLAYDTERKKIFKQFSDLCNKTMNNLNFKGFCQNDELLCQFLLDPTSLNLPVRVSVYDPLVTEFYKLSRDLCFLIDKKRKKLLKEL